MFITCHSFTYKLFAVEQVQPIQSYITTCTVSGVSKFVDTFNSNTPIWLHLSCHITLGRLHSLIIYDTWHLYIGKVMIKS